MKDSKSKYPTGADESPYDIRTFTYSGDKATTAPYEVGESWAGTEYIEDQYKVGICTAISTTMKARQHFKMDFSDDFQYLLQKKFIDKNWNEGSSAFSACKAGHTYGFLPASEWAHTTIDDRKLSYTKYIKKLQSIPDAEIARLILIASKYKIAAYAKITNHTDAMAAAIAENGSVISRFVIGKEWWTRPIEPLRASKAPISGHLVNITKRHGDSYRIANSWGTDWADGGTAYGLYSKYAPTEMWQVWFADIPKDIQVQLDQRQQMLGQIYNLLQKLISLVK
jgi:hypothetical protein